MAEGVAGAMEGCERQFPAFPFKPYPIQLRFMNAVYRALQEGGVAIVESPTGFFGSLSSIPSCSFRILMEARCRVQVSVYGSGVFSVRYGLDFWSS